MLITGMDPFAAYENRPAEHTDEYGGGLGGTGGLGGGRGLGGLGGEYSLENVNVLATALPLAFGSATECNVHVPAVLFTSQDAVVGSTAGVRSCSVPPTHTLHPNRFSYARCR